MPNRDMPAPTKATPRPSFLFLLMIPRPDVADRPAGWAAFGMLPQTPGPGLLASKSPSCRPGGRCPLGARASQRITRSRVSSRKVSPGSAGVPPASFSSPVNRRQRIPDHRGQAVVLQPACALSLIGVTMDSLAKLQVAGILRRLAAGELQFDCPGSDPIGGNRLSQVGGETGCRSRRSDGGRWPWRRQPLWRQAVCGRDARAPRASARRQAGQFQGFSSPHNRHSCFATHLTSP